MKNQKLPLLAKLFRRTTSSSAETAKQRLKALHEQNAKAQEGSAEKKVA